ncbi:2'-5' RNA ligase family protein [uncultured Rothia sp.]|uniref:2'-5' RNA ligase family protein n=1 Tax=uncultured Rothia sp. TaxID=316088 RepID=UPI0032165034
MMNNSPTLVQGEQYVSVTAAVPLELSGRIIEWKKSHGISDPRPLSHITAHIASVVEKPVFQPVFAEPLVKMLPFDVSLGEPASFLPSTPVTFFPVNQGKENFLGLRQICSEYWGKSASPFTYVPHLTIAHHLPPALLEDSMRDLSQIPSDLLSFSVTELGIYFFNGQDWEAAFTVSSS